VMHERPTPLVLDPLLTRVVHQAGDAGAMDVDGDHNSDNADDADAPAPHVVPHKVRRPLHQPIG
jgi:hypothetical protein